jgi:hypothetical protein
LRVTLYEHEGRHIAARETTRKFMQVLGYGVDTIVAVGEKDIAGE